MPSLPTASATALQHSQAVQQLICAEISAAGGWISFARYMQLALYAPGMGYYSGGAAKFGGAGDFVTASEISALFGRTLARQAAQLRELIGSVDGGILEFGAGSGRLTLDLLRELEQLDSLPQRYLILEVSAELRQRQQQLLEQHAPHLALLVTWLEHLPAQFTGLALANEVLDAMPVHLVVWRDGALLERGVQWNRAAFSWSERQLTDGELFEAARALNLQLAPGEDYVSEISLAARGFMRSLASILRHGVIMLIDYGFGHSEYYHPQRNQGTLMCHYRHHAHDAPFYLPGLQDITSHVDFSAVAEVAGAAGLELLGYTTQAHFLLNCGVTEILAQTPAENTRDYLPLAQQLQKLVSPAEMGELFKIIACGRNMQQPLRGFSSGDKRRLL